MAQETDKTWVPQVMVKQETLQEVMGEMLDPTAMVKNEEWDLDQVNYNIYNRLGVTQEESHDELFLKKTEVSKNSKLTLQDVTFETSETNDLSDNENNIEDNDDNQEDDDGFANDCGQGNLIIDEQNQLSKTNYDRRKYLFSPRHFQEDNYFEFSISSSKKPNYSFIKTKNKNPNFKPLKLAKQNDNHIHNVRTISGLDLKYKKSNLLSPINKANLPIKKRIKNGKFEANMSSACTNTTVSTSTIMPTNNYLPRLTLMSTSTNSKIWYDPVNNLYIPFVPISPDVNLLLK